MKNYSNTQFNTCIHRRAQDVCAYVVHIYVVTCMRCSVYTHASRMCRVCTTHDPTIYKNQKLCYNAHMRPIVIHHGLTFHKNGKRDTKLYSCPYHQEFFKEGIYRVPNMKVATALYIYYELFYPHTRDRVYQRIHPLWRVILGVRARKIKITDEYSLFLQWVSQQPFTTLPKPGRKWYYFKKKEFLKEAQYFITTSHKWDWVVPYLRKTYPTLNFGDLIYDA